MVHLEIQDRVAILTLDNDAKHNAYTVAMLRDLRDHMRELRDDADVGCVLIHGAGRSFCSGSDTTEVKSVTPAQAAERAHLDYSTKQAITDSPKITIAAVHGYCLGGGLELATACDLRVVDPDSTFGLPEMALGSLPGSGGIQRLLEIVGRGRIMDWMLRSRRFDVAEAQQAGMVTIVSEPGAVLEEALDLARSLSDRNAVAVEVAKMLLDPTSRRSAATDEAIHGIAAASVRQARPLG